MADWVVRNAEFISYTGILFFSLWGAWAVLKQISRIWEDESVRSLSLAYTWFQFMYFMMRVSYGLEKMDWVVILHAALRVVMTAPLVYGIWKFHKHTLREWFVFGCIMAGYPFALAFPSLDLPFLTLSLIGMGFFFHQPYLIFSKRDAGVVEIRVYAVSLIGVSFWVIYSWLTEEWNILVPSAIAVMGNLLTLILILKYPTAQKSAA